MNHEERRSATREANDQGAGEVDEPRRRWPAWATAVLLLILVVALFEWWEWPFLRKPAESVLQMALKREVSLGPDFGIRFFGSLRLRNDLLVIGPPPDGPSLTDRRGEARDFLRASGFHVELPYSTLLGQLGRKSGNKEESTTESEAAEKPRRPPPYIERLEADRLELFLLRLEDGSANWRFGPDDDDEPPALPRFGRLQVRNGQVSLQDAIAQVQVEAAVRTHEGQAVPAPPGSGEEDAPAAGEPQAGGQESGLEASARGRFRGEPLSVRLQADGLLPLAATGDEARPVRVRGQLKLGETVLQLDGQVRDVLQFSALDADFDLRGPSLAALGDLFGLALPATPAYSGNGHINKEGVVWATRVDALKVGSSRLNGRFRYDPRSAVPQLTGELGGQHLLLGDLGPAIGGTSGGQARGKESGKGGRVLPQKTFDLPSLKRMNADVTVRLDRFDLGTPALDVLAPLNARLRLQDQVLTVQELLTRSAGGELRGEIKLDARREVPQFSTRLSWSGVALERFIKVRNTNTRRPAGTAPPAYIGGLFSGRTELSGKGNSTARLLGSLDGNARLWVRNGYLSHLLVELTGLDLAEGLGVLIKGDQPLTMNCAVAGLKIDGGLVRPELALIDTADSTITVVGEVSLADERLALRVSAHPKDRSPITLRSPVHVQGSFAEPDIALDKRSIGLRAAAAAALAAVTPLAALLALVDLGEPEKAVCSEALKTLEKTPPAGKPAPRSGKSGASR